MAFAAPGAMGATVVKDATTGELCSAVSPAINKGDPMQAFSKPQAYQSGGCTVHMSYNPSYPTEMVYSGAGIKKSCFLTYDLHIGPDGWGYLNNLQWLQTPSQSCGEWKPYGTGSGSFTVGPGDVNPSKIFTAANQNTEFNSLLIAEGNGQFGWANTFFRGVSLDATAANPLQLTNQLTTSGSFSSGRWTGDAGLLITH